MKRSLVFLPLIILSVRSIYVVFDQLKNEDLANWRFFAALLGATLTIGTLVILYRQLKKNHSTT